MNKQKARFVEETAVCVLQPLRRAAGWNSQEGHAARAVARQANEKAENPPPAARIHKQPQPSQCGTLPRPY